MCITIVSVDGRRRPQAHALVQPENVYVIVYFVLLNQIPMQISYVYWGQVQ